MRACDASMGVRQANQPPSRGGGQVEEAAESRAPGQQSHEFARSAQAFLHPARKSTCSLNVTVQRLRGLLMQQAFSTWGGRWWHHKALTR